MWEGSHRRTQLLSVRRKKLVKITCLPYLLGVTPGFTVKRAANNTHLQLTLKPRKLLPHLCHHFPEQKQHLILLLQCGLKEEELNLLLTEDVLLLNFSLFCDQALTGKDLEDLLHPVTCTESLQGIVCSLAERLKPPLFQTRGFFYVGDSVFSKGVQFLTFRDHGFSTNVVE